MDGSSGLQNSLKGGQAPQNNLTSSFKSGLRPGTAAVKRESQLGGDADRNTMKARGSQPLSAANQHDASGRVTEIPNFHPDANALRDDDEDLTADNGPASSRSAKQPEEPMDEETAQQVADINKHIHNLKFSSELSKRVQSLIALNEIIQAPEKHEKGIKRTANTLIGSFTHALKEVFDRPRDEIPLRFAKYFVTIINKTCSCRKIMESVNEQDLYELCE